MTDERPYSREINTLKDLAGEIRNATTKEAIEALKAKYFSIAGGIPQEFLPGDLSADKIESLCKTKINDFESTVALYATSTSQKANPDILRLEVEITANLIKINAYLDREDVKESTKRNAQLVKKINEGVEITKEEAADFATRHTAEREEFHRVIELLPTEAQTTPIRQERARKLLIHGDESHPEVMRHTTLLDNIAKSQVKVLNKVEHIHQLLGTESMREAIEKAGLNHDEEYKYYTKLRSQLRSTPEKILANILENTTPYTTNPTPTPSKPYQKTPHSIF
jgi:hypothetical protein